jgi:hypothetical protein
MLQTALPDSVVVQRLEEKLSALGNIIACNDHVALLHPEADPVFSFTRLTFSHFVLGTLFFAFLHRQQKRLSGTR